LDNPNLLCTKDRRSSSESIYYSNDMTVITDEEDEPTNPRNETFVYSDLTTETAFELVMLATCKEAKEEADEINKTKK
jgi:hypothetical protein